MTRKVHYSPYSFCFCFLHFFGPYNFICLYFGYKASSFSCSNPLCCNNFNLILKFSKKFNLVPKVFIFTFFISIVLCDYILVLQLYFPCIKFWMLKENKESHWFWGGERKILVTHISIIKDRFWCSWIQFRDVKV
jgi:hypothetical protein